MPRRSKIAILFIVMAGIIGALLTGCDQTGSGGHMMGAGMMGGGMMDGGMMQRTPPAQGDETLPDARSRGAQLVRHFCGGCHVPPSPAAHTAQEWPGVVARMKGYMATQGKAVPGPEQLGAIVDYLQRHAR